MASPKKPILVTGSHASGSTWVGSMIAHAPRIAYFHEPFNINLDRTFCKARFDQWFTYICHDNEDDYVMPFQDTLAYRFDLSAGIKESTTLKRFVKQTRTLAQFSWFKQMGYRTLIKDPIAIFSVEWLVERFGFQPVILIRHPAAFAGSLKNNKWSHPFGHLASQPLLMRDYLSPFFEQIDHFSREEQDITEQASLLWTMIHHVISIYKQKHPDWIFARHEDLSTDPLGQFRVIFDALDVPFDQRVVENIRYHTENEKNTMKHPKGFPDLRRDSIKNVKNWQSRLTKSEIALVRERTGQVSSLFYTDADWE